jgi:hypothetical protein
MVTSVIHCPFNFWNQNHFSSTLIFPFAFLQNSLNNLFTDAKGGKSPKALKTKDKINIQPAYTRIFCTIDATR